MIETLIEKHINTQDSVIAKHCDEQPTQFVLPDLPAKKVIYAPYQYSLIGTVSEWMIREKLKPFVKEAVTVK